jgi:putative transposase
MRELARLSSNSAIIPVHRSVTAGLISFDGRARGDAGVPLPRVDARGQPANDNNIVERTGVKFAAPAWRRAWGEVIPFYAFPDEVRRIIYSTNAIESLNAKLRRAVRARGHFPTDDSAMKLLFLVLNLAAKEWKMPAREWAMAKAQLAILFEGRFKLA